MANNFTLSKSKTLARITSASAPVVNFIPGQKTPSALSTPVSHPVKGTPVRAIGLLANNFTSGGGVIIGSGTSLEHRKGLVTTKKQG